MEFKIKSYWSYEKGKWDSNQNKYVERTISEVKEKILNITFIKITNKTVLKFIGGPTGYESYYLSDLLNNHNFYEDDQFCICAGTINSWAKCWVKTIDLGTIIQNYQKGKINNTTKRI